MKRLLTLFITLLILVAISAYLLINNKSLKELKEEFIKNEETIENKEETITPEAPKLPQNSNIQEKRDALKKMFN
ncbi:hypothetical protein [Aliarcobacter thereius]|uniref:Uncharacterized protein n=2 Tax=Aliarcobacter thereius TaxID=544718 RepID=A0A5R9H757_9BACT|nr:hypothetical protein [Aliarcobacter thereius]OCL93972.1 hypothetical protein AAX25_00294 [Aliarcobacter thereius]OCL95366.1 hypothetical protein AA347_00820 [Aliarcobacter thereius LMG 24486]QBF16645.1 hypothetical protein ATH_1625 [Aliarcobacter thereius LMG 24486]TLS73110.1 hypothetical protein FE246_01100 [Aliarcobacter thereius]TLS93630.1 hypothetical protein FE244_03210 [Aliarcobacter thereius]